MTVVTKTIKTAQDAATTPAPFPIGMADESGGLNTGPFPAYHYVADPATGNLVTPAQDTTVAAVTAKLPAKGTAGVAATDVITVQGIVSGVAQSVSATSLPLPTGASTAAKQPALGVAGTPSTDVLTVQGAASMTALKVDGSAVTQPASLVAGENHAGEVGGNSVIAGASFSRPADTNVYALGDLVANSTTAGSVVPMQVTAARKNAGTGRVVRVRLTKSSTGLTNAQFRVHLYKTLPTPSNGDNGVWLTDKATDYLDAFDITMDRAFTDGAKGFAAPLNGPFVTFDAGAATQIIYAIIESRAAYTPVSAETFTLALEIDRD